MYSVSPSTTCRAGILVCVVLVFISLPRDIFSSLLMRHVVSVADGGHYETVSRSNACGDVGHGQSVDDALGGNFNATACVGNLPGMMEDLLCEKRPAYLPNYKNPCWNEDGRLQCLPYFMLLGVPKAGTDDLFDRIVANPDVVTHASYKEISYWSRLRYKHLGKVGPVTTYARFKSRYGQASKRIDDNVKNGYHRLIVGDGSITDFADFRDWQQIPQNMGLKEPKVLTPDLMKHLYKKPRFILLLRNPTERLYSQFFFLKMGKSPEEFHTAVVDSLRLEEECLRDHTPRQCLFRREIDLLPVRLYVGCYSVFLREWLRVFPRESFLILRSEDYKVDIKGTVKEVYDFLDLPYDEESLTKVAKMPTRHRTESKHKAGPMLKETRTLLYDFYRNYSRDLATILGDKRYLWEDLDD